mgnify:CR=1 FL=1
MTDEELLAKTKMTRGLAHRARLAEWSKDHRGHSSIVNHAHAWADRGSEFLELADECMKRGLLTPACDCPEGAHDWERHDD